MDQFLEDSSAPILVVVNRFRVAEHEAASFASDARVALATLAQSVGFIDGVLAQSTDEADLRMISTRWINVGSYRRALSRFEVKISAIPLLSTAIDESSAFEAVQFIADGLTRDVASGRAADADVIGLGHASAPVVPPIQS
ncbi:MAG: antibiotic biosynthesis monooxygenase [Actinomycetes bacterium]